MKNENKLIGTSLFTAFTASLCCITPVFALIAGTGGISSTFSWIEPFRPYLIGLTILVLGFAWYQKLKLKKKDIECACDDEKPKFIQSKTFLEIVTVFAVIILAFPYYSQIFYPDNKKEVIIINKSNFQTVNFVIKGMTCTACEEHVKHAANELDGIVNIEVSYETANAKIEFDNTKTSNEAIVKAINTTGYKVTDQKQR